MTQENHKLKIIVPKLKTAGYLAGEHIKHEGGEKIAISLEERKVLALEKIADFVSKIYLTDKGRLGTNDYATYMNVKLNNQLLKAILIEIQKLNALRQKVSVTNK